MCNFEETLGLPDDVDGCVDLNQKRIRNLSNMYDRFFLRK